MIKTILKIIASALIATGTIAIMINVGFIKIGKAAILDPVIIKLETELEIEKIAHNGLKNKVLEAKEAAVDKYFDYYFNQLGQTSIEYTAPDKNVYLIIKK